MTTEKRRGRTTDRFDLDNREADPKSASQSVPDHAVDGQIRPVMGRYIAEELTAHLNARRPVYFLVNRCIIAVSPERLNDLIAWTVVRHPDECSVIFRCHSRELNALDANLIADAVVFLATTHNFNLEFPETGDDE